MVNAPLSLKDFTYSELFQSAGLARLDETFLIYLAKINKNLQEKLLAYRKSLISNPLETSELLIAVAEVLEKFLIDLFSIQKAATLATQKTIAHNPVALFKKNFIHFTIILI